MFIETHPPPAFSRETKCAHFVSREWGRQENPLYERLIPNGAAPAHAVKQRLYD
jgi:hypothetical protein